MMQPIENTLLAARVALLAHFVGSAPTHEHPSSKSRIRMDRSRDFDSENANSAGTKTAKPSAEGGGKSRWGTVKLGSGFASAVKAKHLDLADWMKNKNKVDIEKETARVRKLFDEIDEDGSGELEFEEVRLLLGSIDDEIHDEEVQKVFTELDRDEDGIVTFSDFLDWWQTVRSDREGNRWAGIVNVRNRELQEKEDLEELFSNIDKDGGGTIDAGELLTLTSDLGLALTSMEIQEAMRDIDGDDDGEIEFPEFYEWFRGQKEEQFGLAVEMQRGLHRSHILRSAKDSVMSALEGSKSTEALRRLFDRLDHDGGGSLGYEELVLLCDILQLNLSPTQLKQALKEMDTDKDGEICFEEFEQWWLSNQMGDSGKLRSQIKLSGFLAKTSGNVLIAQQLVDQDEAAMMESEAYLQDLLSSSFARSITMDGKSLGIFPADSPVRMICAEVLGKKPIEWFLIACIVLNLVAVICIKALPEVAPHLAFMNVMITIIFTAEALMRVIAQGLIGKHGYLSSSWNIFDLILIVAVWSVWLLGLFYDMGNVADVVSVLRSCRGLRFFKHIRQILMALHNSYKVLSIIIYAMVVLFMVFGVLFHALFNGSLTHKCWDPADFANCPRCQNVAEHCPAPLGCEGYGLECYVLSRGDVTGGDRQAHTDKYGFDNAATSALTMFSMATMDDWQAFVNAFREADPVHSKTTVALGAFVIICSLMYVNFFLAAISFSYIKVRSDARQAEMQRTAEETVVMQLLEGELPEEIDMDTDSPRESKCCNDKMIQGAHVIVTSETFDSFILIVVALNITLMASDHYPKSDGFVTFVELCELVFYLIYLFEFVVKVIALGWVGYLKVVLNRLDFIIVLAATFSYAEVLLQSVFGDTLKDIVIFRLLRMGRLFRAARVARIIMRSNVIRRMMESAFAGRAAIVSLTGLILFFLVIMAIVAHEFFADCALHGVEFQPLRRPNFSTFGSSFIANFIILSTDSWTALAFDYIECHPVFGTGYFLLMVVVLFFVLSNLFVAVFFESFELEDDDKREEQIKEYLLESQKQSAEGMNAVDVKSRLDTVDDFLHTTRSKMGGAGHMSFDKFVGGIRMSTHTAASALMLAPKDLIKAPKNCFLACFSSKKAAKDDFEPAEGDDWEAGDGFENPVNEAFEDAGQEKIRATSATFQNSPGARGGDRGTREPFRDKSCGLFLAESPFREKCAATLQNMWFRRIVIWACAANVASVTIDDWDLKRSDVDEAARFAALLLEIIPALVFFVELVLQCVSNGVMMTSDAYLGQLRGWYELTCAVLAIVTIEPFYPSSRPLRSIIAFRLLYLARHLSIIMETVGKTFSAVWTACVLMLATFLIFGILGIMFLGGKLNYCDETSPVGLMLGAAMPLGKDECLAAGHYWVPRPFNFDNIIDSSRSLFIVWSLQGWTPLLLEASDSVGFDAAPQQDANQWPAFMFFASYLMLNSFILTKLFVGMLADFFASSSGNLLLTAEQRNWQFTHLFIYHVITIKKVPRTTVARFCFTVAEHPWFLKFVDLVVVLNVLQLIGVASIINGVLAQANAVSAATVGQVDGVDVEVSGDSVNDTVDVDAVFAIILAGQWFAIGVYVIEFLLKLIGYGPVDYFINSKFEFVILAGMITATVEFQLRQYLKLSSFGWFFQGLQASRVLRLVSVMGRRSAQVRKMYYTVVVSLPQCMNLVSCMIVVIHVFSVFGKVLCGGAPISTFVTPMDNFDSAASSMRVLFQISTGEAFHGFISECMAHSNYPNAITAFFFAFFVAGNFVFISLFVALLLDNLDLIASDDFAVSDLDIELFREQWIASGLRLDEPINVRDLRVFVRDAKGTFAMIHKADPYWYNRLLFELQLEPEDEHIGEETVEFFRLLRAVCHIRFSSKCLALEDEVQKSDWLGRHHYNHAVAIIQTCVRAWWFRHHPPQEILDGRPYKSALSSTPKIYTVVQWRAAVNAVQLLQLSAVVRTQRVTPEHVVSDNLDRLQKLVDRRAGREQLKSLTKENRTVVKQQNKDARAEAKAAGKTGSTNQISLKELKAGKKNRFVSFDEVETPLYSEDVSFKDPKKSQDELVDAMQWKDRSAFLTRRTMFSAGMSDDADETSVRSKKDPLSPKSLAARKEAGSSGDSQDSQASGHDST
eukprot:SAG22_NODE_200_length_15420_cov_4.424581_4_plen_2131_part_00